jgi:hypothetical protein
MDIISITFPKKKKPKALRTLNLNSKTLTIFWYSKNTPHLSHIEREDGVRILSLILKINPYPKNPKSKFKF